MVAHRSLGQDSSRQGNGGSCEELSLWTRHWDSGADEFCDGAGVRGCIAIDFAIWVAVFCVVVGGVEISDAVRDVVVMS